MYNIHGELETIYRCPICGDILTLEKDIPDIKSKRSDIPPDIQKGGGRFCKFLDIWAAAFSGRAAAFSGLT